MNRLSQSEFALQSRRIDESRDQSAKKFAARPRRRPSHHRFLVPLHYESNYAYPLLVWLHGPTGSEYEINQVMPHISMRNFVAVAPRGVLRHSAVHPDGSPTYTWDEQLRSIDLATEDVYHCIASAKERFNIAPDRVFLIGNDIGGTVAMRIALSDPGRFAGVASVGGSMPQGLCPLAKLHTARSLPMLITHGGESDVYSTTDVSSDLKLLHTAGMSVTLRQYPCGHEVTTKMLSDINTWVMEQVAGPSTSVITENAPTTLGIQDHN